MTHEFSQLNIFESYVVCILVGVNLEAEFVFCSISCWVGIIMLEFCVCLADGSPAISLVSKSLESKAICHLAFISNEKILEPLW